MVYLELEGIDVDSFAREACSRVRGGCIAIAHQNGDSGQAIAQLDHLDSCGSAGLSERFRTTPVDQSRDYVR